MNDTDGRRRAARGWTVEQRFWAKVAGGDWRECWLWTAALKQGSGYPAFQLAGKVVAAHRWAYECLIGPIPDDLQLDHLCRVRHCVNPWHLEPVPGLVNVRRGQGNVSKTHCPFGHPYDAENTRLWRGRRVCRECNRERAKTWRRAQHDIAA